jgi:hypothetical protein
MTAAPVLLIKPHAVAHIEPLQGSAQVGFFQLQQQMIMVVHQDIHMQTQSKSQDGFLQQFQKMAAIPILSVNLLPLITARADVIPTAGSFNAQWPGHARTLLHSFQLMQLLIVRS